MPLYEYKCSHNHSFTAFKALANYRDPVLCDACRDTLDIDNLGIKQLSAPLSIRGDNFEPFISPASGKLISSHAERREDFKRTGTREYDPEMKKDAERFRVDKEKKLEQSVDSFIEGKMALIHNDTPDSRLKEILA